MSGTEPFLDRAAIEGAFRKLGDRLARRGVVADIYVIGGAAMALAYDARRSTRDIDAVFEPHGIVLDEARDTAKELGLPPWWLNEQASVYVAPGGDPAARRVFDHPGLGVSFVATSERKLSGHTELLDHAAPTLAAQGPASLADWRRTRAAGDTADGALTRLEVGAC